ncbi:Spy/CpxP family protein refolding chaperone [Solimicrobium silvestre]|uniref:LTXXQ motif family protein n=1 Tax=Solimicrobium silvestre TaxID=2099400 RepID=A0A2S9GUS0_9BURK|nr:Spy/CpxP family protein refolding chaperone [Solimicrobium silvestre]PRC91453.1 LTXXQ motif family protein [Solimicrobium silvestre]
MKKYITALVSTLLISGAYAQTPAVTAGAAASVPVSASAPASPASMAKSDAKRDQANEKHIKELHTKLKITKEQETLWDTVAKTMRDSANEIDKVIDKRESLIPSATAIDDLNAYADIAQAHADSVKKLSMVFGPLYAAMSDTQKKEADEIFTQRGHAGKDQRISAK